MLKTVKTSVGLATAFSPHNLAATPITRDFHFDKLIIERKTADSRGFLPSYAGRNCGGYPPHKKCKHGGEDGGGRKQEKSHWIWLIPYPIFSASSKISHLSLNLQVHLLQEP
jgi:hypothetical protein